MKYDKLRNKVNKFYTGGQIQKLEFGGVTNQNLTPELQQKMFDIMQNTGLSQEETLQRMQNQGLFDTNISQDPISSPISSLNISASQNGIANLSASDPNTGMSSVSINQDKLKEVLSSKKENIASLSGGSGLSNAGKGMIAQAAVGAVKAIDDLAMGDKNFGAQSQAIDSAVHGVSGALMSSGNPYAMIAGAAIEGANFLTKAGGQTVQGYDVNIENSGYGTLGHMESSSSRDWGAAIGLGGLFNKGAMERKLAKRNEQARMAMRAAEISEDIKFEQEARMNSVDNVLRNNQIALAGGLDLNLLGA